VFKQCFKLDISGDTCYSPYNLVNGPHPVADAQMTASSWHEVGDGGNYRASQARLNNTYVKFDDGTYTAGIWHAAASADTNEYIQVREVSLFWFKQIHFAFVHYFFTTSSFNVINKH